MKSQTKFFHCTPNLLKTHSKSIAEIHQCVDQVQWAPEFSFQTPAGKEVLHQTAYNKDLENEFKYLGWELQPLLLAKPRLIGDFRKHLVFVEIQFGNSATLYRDYYKFQYGLANGLLSLASADCAHQPQGVLPNQARQRSEHGRVRPGRALPDLVAYQCTYFACWVAAGELSFPALLLLVHRPTLFACSTTM